MCVETVRSLLVFCFCACERCLEKIDQTMGMLTVSGCWEFWLVFVRANAALGVETVRFLFCLVLLCAHAYT